jgi:serine/threonine-protein kinase
MNCFKCGKPLEAGARFCGGCGSQQPGAVIPQASVRTGAKTLFQGSGVVSPVAKPPGAASGPATGAAPTPAPNPTPKRSSALGYAQTIAPGTGQLDAIRPPKPDPAPAAPARPVTAPQPVAQAEAPTVDGGDLTGRTLNNRYLVEAKVGEGGFGSVYRAKQTQMNRVVALKVLHARMAKDAQVVGRFKREAQASSLLRAPHTVQVYDFDQTPEGIMYLAMEMLQGRSLHSVLATEALDPIRVARIMDGIAESLDEAHKQGIVHRDIKPENIFLEPRPTPDFVKVLDFGIAKIVSGDGLASSGPALTAAGQTLGTLEYMSPEQLMGAQLDGRSDLYALGILAYEMLLGELPFPSKTPGELITAHLKTVPPPPSQRAPGRNIPPLMDEIILKLVEKQRDKRFKDTAELRAQLQRVIAGEVGAASAQASAPAQPATVPATPRVVASAAPAPAPVAAKAPAPLTETIPRAGGVPPKLLLLLVGLAVGAAVVVAFMFLSK